MISYVNKVPSCNTNAYFLIMNVTKAPLMLGRKILSFDSVFASGIQDVAAAPAVLGTYICNKNVGLLLTMRYLFPALDIAENLRVEVEKFDTNIIDRVMHRVNRHTCKNKTIFSFDAAIMLSDSPSLYSMAGPAMGIVVSDDQFGGLFARRIGYTIELLAAAGIAIGYIGSYLVVQKMIPMDTYYWLGLEFGLYFLRLVIWSWNTGMDDMDMISL